MLFLLGVHVKSDLLPTVLLCEIRWGSMVKWDWKTHIPTYLMQRNHKVLPAQLDMPFAILSFAHAWF